MKNFLKGICPALFLFLTVCQPLHYSFLTPLKSQEDSLKPLLSIESIEQDKRTKIYKSNKLDLVFILNTRPSMTNFYQKNLFGADFLSRFEKYDLKVAWTDMSVNVEKFTEEKPKEKNDMSSCSWARGLIWLGLGVFTQGVALGLATRDIGNCMDQINVDRETEDKAFLTNGAFRPFEYKGKKWPKDKSKQNHLYPSVKNYKGIFDHSMQQGNPGEKNASYQAPGQIQEKAYPFLSLFLSLFLGSLTEDPKQQAFFREDSSVVYVLVTVDGFKKSLPPEKFKNIVKNVLGSEERLRIIPVTFNEKSSFLCEVHSDSDTEPSPMIEFSKKFAGSALNICSPNLGEELFEEISKSLALPQEDFKTQSSSLLDSIDDSPKPQKVRTVQAVIKRVSPSPDLKKTNSPEEFVSSPDEP